MPPFSECLFRAAAVKIHTGGQLGASPQEISECLLRGDALSPPILEHVEISIRWFFRHGKKQITGFHPACEKDSQNLAA
jgi:hypothetical protein